MKNSTVLVHPRYIGSLGAGSVHVKNLRQHLSIAAVTRHGTSSAREIECPRPRTSSPSDGGDIRVSPRHGTRPASRRANIRTRHSPVGTVHCACGSSRLGISTRTWHGTRAAEIGIAVWGGHRARPASSRISVSPGRSTRVSCIGIAVAPGWRACVCPMEVTIPSRHGTRTARVGIAVCWHRTRAACVGVHVRPGHGTRAARVGIAIPTRHGTRAASIRASIAMRPLLGTRDTPH